MWSWQVLTRSASLGSFGLSGDLGFFLGDVAVAL